MTVLERTPQDLAGPARIVTAFALLFPLTVVIGHLGLPVLAAGVVVALLVVWCSVEAAPAYAAAVGALAWLFLTGFVVNDLGQLTFSTTDLGRLALLVSAAGLTARATPRPHWRR